MKKSKLHYILMVTICLVLTQQGMAQKAGLKKIDVSEENPFENDKLNRKDSVENLTTLLANLSTPIVLSINAPWGSGKTTYVQMCHKHLVSKNENSIYC